MQGKIKIKGNMGVAMKLDAVNAAVKKLADSQPKSAVVFAAMGEAIKTKGPELVKKIKGIICYKITGNPSGSWTLDLKNGSGSLEKDSTKKADMTITIKDDDMMDLVSGKLNGQQAFMSGKIKIKGNMGLAMKMDAIVKAMSGDSKL